MASDFHTACDNVPPKSAQQTPSVDFMVINAAREDMATNCQKVIPVGSRIYGCTFEPGVVAADWAIILDQTMTSAERDCTLLYEKAHLPPNNWRDSGMEALIPDETKYRTWLGLH